jgi:hypothetical protein
MDIGETVRRSTWHRRPLGRRVMSDTAPYFAISASDDEDPDVQRRRALAATAGLGS